MRARGPARWRRILVGAAMLLGALVLPAGANAATANVSGGNLNFFAAQGEANDLNIEKDGGVFRVFDGAAPVTAGGGCSQRSIHRVSCTSAGVTLVRVFAGDQDDDVLTLIGSTDALLAGGPGIDTLIGSEGVDTISAGRGGFGFTSETLRGNGGEDTLNGPTTSNGSSFLDGGPGDDQLLGGRTNDSLVGGIGADLMQGEEGNDTVFYGISAAPVTVTVGSGANDGAAGEGDDVRGDVETVFGTSFDDHLIGAAGSQALFGTAGKDTLEGASGNDSLQAGDGADTLMGQGGADDLLGGPRADDLSGGTERDEAAYNDHSEKVKVTIDNVANDGSGGGAEGDNVRTDIEDVAGGSNDDLLIGNGQDNRIIGNGGDDDVQGGDGDDDLFGDSTGLGGASGDDQLGGGPGNDQLSGGDGADKFQGAEGSDFADYSQVPFFTNLTITIDNVANDGAAGEGDNVMDTVEGVHGGSGNDSITGSSAANTLIGGSGADTLVGAGDRDLMDGESPSGCCGGFGPDDFSGGSGIDTVTYRSHGFIAVTVDIDGVADDGAFGGSEGDNVETTVENLIGSDTNDSLTGNGDANAIAGRGGFDSLFGGAGPDFLSGDDGGDVHNGEAGKDEINSRGDGITDTDNCGTEADVAIADAFDTVNADCETQIP
jgi:Ca2+-binding RTX toxin-like protein